MKLIDSDSLKENLCTACTNGVIDSTCDYSFDGCEIIEIINNQPEIEAEPVRHGYWIIRGGDMWCSECDYGDVTEFGEPEDYRYCPYCGAKMDGDEK